MFERADFEEHYGRVDVTTFTCDTDCSLVAALPGHTLRVYKVIVDGPDPAAIPRVILTDG